MTTLRLVAHRAATEPVGPGAESRPEPSLARCLAPLSPLLDLSRFAELDHPGARALLRDLAFAIVELARGQRERHVVPTETGASRGRPAARTRAVWEIGLERDGDEILCSVFRQGSQPEVAQTERALPLSTARDAVACAIERYLDSGAGRQDDAALERGLALAARELEAIAGAGIPPSQPLSRQRVQVSSGRRSRLVIQATLDLRRGGSAVAPEVARADLHALLFRGSLCFGLGKSVRRLSGVHVFLIAEQLAALVAQVFDARGLGRGMQRRVRVGEALCGVQLDEAGNITLLLGGGGDAIGWRLPALPWDEFAQAVIAFGRRMIKAVLSADRAQSANLRVRRFRAQLGELRERLRGEAAGPSKVNDRAESYRAFAESDSVRTPSVPQLAPAVGKLRFDESWRADVPGIDLRSLFVSGDRLLISAARELACIERTSGQLLWTRRSHRAVSLLTPAGLVRLGADGLMVLHDVSDGEPVLELKLGPCVGATTSGTVVHAPGLPQMLLVAEGARHLAAVDLDSSEVRWRRAVRRSGSLRLRRAGKLLVAASGETQLVALDLLSGEVVWRRSSRRRYAHGVTIDQGELFAVASELPSRPGAATLEHIDPFSGKLRWRRALPRPLLPQGAPIVTRSAVVVLTRDAAGERLGAIGIDRASGQLIFDLPGGLCEGRAGWLVVDDLLVVNGERGELVAVSLPEGRTRYRHVFAGWNARCHPADRPQCVQPVLRSGALFLPQSEVYVVRPSDGAMLGRLPCDLVPDAMRVDERCGVYVAEASGYLAAFHALPMLTLVKPI